MKHFPRIFSILLIVLGTSLIVFRATYYFTRMGTLEEVEHILRTTPQPEVWGVVSRIDLQKGHSWVLALSPALLFGGLLILAGVLAPFSKRKPINVAEPDASPNGGPAKPVKRSA